MLEEGLGRAPMAPLSRVVGGGQRLRHFLWVRHWGAPSRLGAPDPRFSP